MPDPNDELISRLCEVWGSVTVTCVSREKLQEHLEFLEWSNFSVVKYRGPHEVGVVKVYESEIANEGNRL